MSNINSCYHCERLLLPLTPPPRLTEKFLVYCPDCSIVINKKMDSTNKTRNYSWLKWLCVCGGKNEINIRVANPAPSAELSLDQEESTKSVDTHSEKSDTSSIRDRTSTFNGVDEIKPDFPTVSFCQTENKPTPTDNGIKEEDARQLVDRAQKNTDAARYELLLEGTPLSYEVYNGCTTPLFQDSEKAARIAYWILRQNPNNCVG
jgi:hypothetical protein